MAACVRAGILYWMSVHSDMVSLRGGCTFVIDSTNAPDRKVGNERKLQKTWQSLPLRPQNLYIVGASFVKRLFINALIKFASVFSNSKVLARIQVRWTVASCCCVLVVVVVSVMDTGNVGPPPLASLLCW